MTINESLGWLHSTQQFGIKLGLDNTRRLLEATGNPEQRLEIFHIAGTNGKGSVCAMIDAILRASGRRSGLYTSPHLMDFRERIRVDGEMIPKEIVAGRLTDLRKISGAWDPAPTFFELTTVLALGHFAEAACDYVVLETGLGGRLDATNAPRPLVSVITPIARDHSEWLGHTISEIAAEKAGIIKPGVPVISSPQLPEAEAVLRETAQREGAPIRFIAEPWSGATALAGAHQKWNAALACAALEAAAVPCTESDMARGMQSVRWPARFQRLGERVVLDAAHNPHAVQALVGTWREEFGDRKASVVFGAMKDKDYQSMIGLLAPIAAEFFFVPVENIRAASPSIFFPSGPVPFRYFADLGSAINAAFASPDPLLIAGSLFLAGEAMALLKDPAPLSG